MEKYIQAFWNLKNTDYQKLEKIWNYFGDFEEAWRKGKTKDMIKAGLKNEYAEEFQAVREKLDLEAAMDRLWRADIVAIGRNSPEYPAQLKQIEKAPFLLYRKGASLGNFDGKMIAVVGMRKSTVQGEKMAFALARNLALKEKVVVSGLAFGIDAAAHSGVISVKCPTIGVLASGINKITPSSHYGLAEKILAEGGSIISEYPITSDAYKQRFLERNRIIAGLAEAVVVVEAAEKSGALITANLAWQQNKDILAFPGDPGKIQSKGCNNLIKNQMAQLVDSIGDVLKYLSGGVSQKIENNGNFNLEEEKILKIITEKSLDTEEIWQKSGYQLDQLLAVIGQLELAGIIYRDNLQKWRIKP